MTHPKRRMSKAEIVDTAISLHGNYRMAKKKLKHEKKASMENKYLEKIAEKHKAGYGTAALTELKATGRGLGEGILGGLAGDILTHGVKGFTGRGTMAGGLGFTAGSIHGALASLKNSLNAQREKKAEIEGTILGPKAKAKKVLEAMEKKRAAEKVESIARLKKGGKVAAGVIAAGAAGAAAKKYLSPRSKDAVYHEKKAWTEQCLKTMARKASKAKEMKKEAGLATSLLGAAKNFGRAAASDASKLGGQIKNVGVAYKANKGFGPGTRSTVRALAGNKALQAGAGLAAGGFVAGRAMSKQSSVLADNKYLQKVAMFGGIGNMLSGGMASIGNSIASFGSNLASNMPRPSMSPSVLSTAGTGSTIGVRG